MIVDDDLPNIAGTIRNAGELLEAHGPTLLQLAKDWANGPAAANLDPNSRSNHYDTDNNAPIPTDPTGEAAIGHDPNRHLDRDVQALINHTHQLATELRNTIMGLVTTAPQPLDPTQWCTHHLHAHISEIRYRGDLCRWCYDFKATHRVLPPLTLLGHRHLGKRITEAMIASALEAEGIRTEQLATTNSAMTKARGPRGWQGLNGKKTGARR